VCDYPLARNLILLVVAVASEGVVRFALAGTRDDWSVTLRDSAVRPWRVDRGYASDNAAIRRPAAPLVFPVPTRR